MKVKFTGDKTVQYKTKDGKILNITLNDVQYVPKSTHNLFSINTVINKGWNLRSDNGKLLLKKNKNEICFSEIYTSTNKYLNGIKFTASDTVKIRKGDSSKNTIRKTVEEVQKHSSDVSQKIPTVSRWSKSNFYTEKEQSETSTNKNYLQYVYKKKCTVTYSKPKKVKVSRAATDLL